MIETLIRDGLSRSYAAGQSLLHEDQPELKFFVLLRGSVRVFYTSAEGLQVVVKVFHGPAAFGEMECLSNIPYLESVEAMEPSRVLEVPRAVFLSCLNRSHRLTYNLLGDLAARLCIAAQNERALAFLPVETRLANLLKIYLELYGLPVRDGTKIRIPLSQEDFADALGVARRSITRALKRWTDEGTIKKQGAHFVVCDVAKIEADGDRKLLPIAHRLGSVLRR